MASQVDVIVTSSFLHCYNKHKFTQLHQKLVMHGS